MVDISNYLLWFINHYKPTFTTLGGHNLFFDFNQPVILTLRGGAAAHKPTSALHSASLINGNFRILKMEVLYHIRPFF